MAISGVVDADVTGSATKYAKSRKETAAILGNYSLLPKSITFTDGGSHVGHLVMTNLHGMATIDWGDGTVVQQGAQAGAVNHTYGSSGAKTVKVVAYGTYLTAGVTLA